MVLCYWPTDFFIHWKDDIVDVKQLYHERKYRRCAGLCSELLEEAIHPVHKAFLYFYQAICYESLGHVAHDYSSNKIPLLEKARDAFLSAGEVLSLPSISMVDGKDETSDHSSACATFEIAAFYRTPAPSSIYTPNSLQVSSVQQSESGSTTPTPFNCTQRTYSIPEFDDYSPRQILQPKTPTRDGTTQSLLTSDQPVPTLRNHKTRLSRTLSPQHILTEKLVPSPLFSRDLTIKNKSETVSSTLHIPVTSQVLSIVALVRPLPPTPINKPLPDLPFNHKPQFIQKEKRLVVVPRRTTALSTLISRFEGTGPFDEVEYPSRRCDGHDYGRMNTEKTERTPVTERFKKISAVFVEKDEQSGSHGGTIGRKLRACIVNTTIVDSSSEDSSNGSDDKENIDPDFEPPVTPTRQSHSRKTVPPQEEQTSNIQTPQTPTPIIKITISPQHTVSPPPSPLLTPSNTTSSPTPIHRSHPPSQPPTHQPTSTTYTTALLSLRKSLTSHTTSVAHTISTILKTQATHDAEKRARFQTTYASHPFSSTTSTPDSPSPNRKTKARTKLTTTTTSVTSPSASVSATPRPRPTRLHSFWSLPSAPPTTTTPTNHNKHTPTNIHTNTHTHTHTHLHPNHPNNPPRRHNERITRLKRDGWPVRKDSVGFKGTAYYSSLVTAVEGELRG